MWYSWKLHDTGMESTVMICFEFQQHVEFWMHHTVKVFVTVGHLVYNRLYSFVTDGFLCSSFVNNYGKNLCTQTICVFLSQASVYIL